MPQRLKRLIGNTYQSWKVSKRYPPHGGEGRGGGKAGYSTKLYTGRLNPEVQPLTLLYAVFERRRYPFRAEPLGIAHYREYHPPPPEKNEKLSAGSSPPLRPLNFFIHSEVKRTLETFPFVHFSRKYFYAPAHTRKKKKNCSSDQYPCSCWQKWENLKLFIVSGNHNES